MQTYTTVEGDTVDLIAWHKFAQTKAVTELILTMNPGLAARGPVLPKGLVIVLPDAAPKSEQSFKRIWS